MVTEEFLKDINISKITYSYKFPYNYEYKLRDKKCNKARNKFLQSIYDRLLKLNDGTNIIINRPNYIIELKYFYMTKYYNININSERIIFNNIDFENTGELEIIVLNLIGYNLIEMGKYEHHNIVYKIDFGSCYINKMIPSFNDFMFDEDINMKKQLIINNKSVYNFKPRSVYIHNNKNQSIFKINLKGRNTWLISQNMNFTKSTDEFIKFYLCMKSIVILPNLLRYLHKNKDSLFNYLLPEIIDIITNMLYQNKNHKIKSY